MDQKRSKKGNQNSRIARLRKRKRKTRRIIMLLTMTLLLILTGLIINKAYVSSKCTSLEYAVDHYFTTWSNKDLRLANVKTMELINKNENTATIEAFGFSYKEPRQRTTLVGEFVKDKNGSWVMKTVENKNDLSAIN